MNKPTLSRSVLVSCAALLTVFAVSDRASALPITGGDIADPSDPITKPTKPPIIITCPAPTLAQCQDPSYLSTTCGVRSKTACGNLVLPIYHSQISGISATTKILAGTDPTHETLQTAKLLDPIAQPATKYTFGTFSSATVAQLGRVKPASASTANIDPQHPDYEANGAAVASCQEYAYESLYDDERFAEAAETCGTNAECVYQLSLRTTTPGLKTTMLKKNGAPMSWQPVRAGAYSQIKNAFFANGAAALTVGASYLTTHPSYGTDPAFRAKADAIIAWVNGTPKASAASELDWHHAMHDAFVAHPVSASEIASIRTRKNAYGDATTSAAVAKFAIAMLQAVIPGQSGQTKLDSIALLAQYQAQNSNALAQMANLLFAEWDRLDPSTGVVDHGCLNRSNVKCDWSPAQFVSRYAGHNSTLNEQLFSSCITATAGDFAKVPASYRTDTDTLATWIEAQGLPKLAASTVGQRTSDGDTWGDTDWFAAGYSYDAGWQLAADRQSGTNRICKLKGDAYANAYANAWALGQQISILDTQHKLSVRENADHITFHSHLRVLGNDIYSPINYDQTLPSLTPINKNPNVTLAQQTYTKWITIAGVAVKLQAKAEIKAGADLNATATAASGCNPDNLAYDANISVRPWVGIHVVPEVSVGIGIIQGGVRGDIDLVKVSAPVSGGAKAVGGQNDITLQFRANGSVDLAMLKGDIDIFLESCVPFVGCADLASKQIYSFDGYDWKFPLFSYSKDVKINVFDTATRPLIKHVGDIGTIGTISMQAL